MRERVLAIVTILARYFLEERDFGTESDLVEELLASGFDSDEIDAAFSWMQKLSVTSDLPLPEVALRAVPTMRVFAADELRLLTTEARGFLVRLRSLGILDDTSQEEIIERAFQLGEDEVSLKEIKVMTSLTLFARANEDWRQAVDALMGDDWSRMFH